MAHEFQIEVDQIEMFAGETWHDLGDPCDHDCPHNALSVVAWGPDRTHYELNHCDRCGCRAWLDGRYYLERQRDPREAEFWLTQQTWLKPLEADDGA
jgi:hypothetical protein